MDVLDVWRATFLAGTLAAALGCQPEIVPEPYVPTDAHDAYRHALEVSGLSATALGRDWSLASKAALRSSTEIDIPFKETVYVDPARAFATSYAFAVARGQRTEIQLTLQPTSVWRIYLDLFRLPEEAREADNGPVHVASGGEGDLRLAFEPRRDGRYLLRLQSELLRGGSATVEIKNVASLEFPVSGHDTGSIGSGFGAPREGGRRAHHGIDIFAPRRTEVLATSRAKVRRVDEWKLGGNIIWLEDRERNLRLYFAHLQTQDVKEGDWVEPGDRIGTVGNSGNARTTPPHLHFGIYMRGEGPIDPRPFLQQPRRSPRSIRVNLDNLGRWVRTKRGAVPLTVKARGDEGFWQMEAHTPLWVWGGTDRSYRVALPNGIIGYVRESETEPVDVAIDSMVLSRPTAVLDRPETDAAIVRLEDSAEVGVLARYGRFYLIDTLATRSEWIAAPAATPPAAGS